MTLGLNTSTWGTEPIILYDLREGDEDDVQPGMSQSYAKRHSRCVSSLNPLVLICSSSRFVKSLWDII